MWCIFSVFSMMINDVQWGIYDDLCTQSFSGDAHNHGKWGFKQGEMGKRAKHIRWMAINWAVTTGDQKPGRLVEKRVLYLFKLHYPMAIAHFHDPYSSSMGIAIDTWAVFNLPVGGLYDVILLYTFYYTIYWRLSQSKRHSRDTQVGIRTRKALWQHRPNSP